MESAANHVTTNTLSTDTPIRRKNQMRLALTDLVEGLKKWPVWFMLAYQDIKLRYRRSVLGPFWITLSMAITVYTMGYLYSHLFHSNIHSYFPFLAAGMLSWALISSAITDLTEGFMISEGLIKQIKLPYSLYIHRIVTRNFLIFFHNILVMVPIFVVFHNTVKIDFYTLMLIPGLFMIYINAFFYGLALAMIGARYRDVSQIIRSLVQVAFFITPVMWDPAILSPEKRYIANFNPFYSFIELIRAPLTGNPPVLFHWGMVAIVTLIGIVFSFALFKKYRPRIVYWL
jgi:lipopolysaccharide transport system permease protein